MSARVRTQPPPDPVLEHAPAPDGYEWLWEVDESCRVASDEERRERVCRRPGCEREPVMALARTRFSGLQSKSTWWLYCDWHMYGRVLVDGDVMMQRLRRVES